MALHNTVDDNLKPAVDTELTTIAHYVAEEKIDSTLAYSTARYCLMDSLACAIAALQYPACTKLLGPLVPGTITPNGAHVPGTNYLLDPVLAAFNIGTLIRWLDFNDTWLAAEWGHPSDNLGAILAVCDFVSQKNIASGKMPLLMKEVLTAMIKAHEIQGILALENSFNRLGFDHVFLVKLASTAIATKLLGGTETHIINALTQVFVDGAALRTYRHAPNTGPRKSWAAGDATSRGVRLAWLTMQGEMGYPSALSAKTWGFYDVMLQQQPLKITQPLSSYVMENILFKIAYPAEFHAQTAAECAAILHAKVIDKLDAIEKIILTTQESAIRIISKMGLLHNPADRDHCLQYIVAVTLLQGNLIADYYENEFATDPRIDLLRNKMIVVEDKQFTEDYLDPNKRSIANAIQIFFKDGSQTEKIIIEYPIGHRRRRDTGIPLIIEKFKKHLAPLFSEQEINTWLSLFADQAKLEQMPVNEFMMRWARHYQ